MKLELQLLFMLFKNGPMQDWGRPGDLWNLDIRWHVPSADETTFTFHLLGTILKPELKRLQSFAEGEQEMSRYNAMHIWNVQYILIIPLRRQM